MISTNSINKQTYYKLLGIAGAFITLAVPYYLHTLHTGDEMIGKQSLCPFKMLTGFPCPGCGITKSLMFLYEGEWKKSLEQHLFGPFVVLFCILSIMILTVEIATGKKFLRSWLYSMNVAYILGTILTSYHLIRLIVYINSYSFNQIIGESIWK